MINFLLIIIPACSKAKEAFCKLKESISQYYKDYPNYKDYPKDKDCFELQASQFAFVLSTGRVAAEGSGRFFGNPYRSAVFMIVLLLALFCFWL